MIVHRLVKAAYIALDGEGARLYGGRWNTPGRAMVYTSASPSLTVLEILVHLDLPPELMPSDYRLLTISVPDKADFERLDSTPREEAACVRIGDDFLRRGQALALSVPSAVVPQERNLLINPSHTGVAAIEVLKVEPFALDPRLLS